MRKYPPDASMGNIAAVVVRILLLLMAILFIIKAFFVALDNDGTNEITLVRVNGSTFCQSCMGLYQ